MSASSSDYLRQTMPQSTNSTSGTISACWHTAPSSGLDLACDKDFYSFYLSTRQKWPPLAQPISDTFPDMKTEMKQYGHFQILVANIMCSFPSRGIFLFLATYFGAPKIYTCSQFALWSSLYYSLRSLDSLTTI